MDLRKDFIELALHGKKKSPRYVMERDGYEAGKAMLKRIRRGNVEVKANEIHDAIQEEANVEQVGFTGLFTERNLRKRVIIACGLVIAQQLTGVNAFLSYAGSTFTKCGFDDPVLINVYFNLFMMVFCGIGLALIDSAYGGRRGQLAPCCHLHHGATTYHCGNSLGQ